MPAWSSDLLAPTDAKLTEDGIRIDSDTSISNWDGKPLDLPYVIGVAWRPGDSPGPHEQPTERSQLARPVVKAPGVLLRSRKGHQFLVRPGTGHDQHELAPPAVW